MKTKNKDSRFWRSMAYITVAILAIDTALFIYDSIIGF